MATRTVEGEVEQTVVLLGNPNPMMQVKVPHPDPDLAADGHIVEVGRPAKHLNQSVTRVELWPGFDDPDFVEHSLSTDNDRLLTIVARSLDDADRHYAVGLIEIEQLLFTHSAGTAPTWVDSSDKRFAEVLAAHFQCAVGEPTNLLTTVGRDALHDQHLKTSAPPATFNYMALTASVTAPAAGDTTLTGEIATAGGGLLRAQATYAHTAGTNTSTLTKTFTANGSDTLPVTIAQIGVFNASTVGTLAYHTALSSTATLNVSGDSVTITETITGG